MKPITRFTPDMDGKSVRVILRPVSSLKRFTITGKAELCYYPTNGYWFILHNDPLAQGGSPGETRMRGYRYSWFMSTEGGVINSVSVKAVYPAGVCYCPKAIEG